VPEAAALAAIVAAAAYGLVSGFNDGGNLLASFTSGRRITPRLAVLLLCFSLAGPLLVGYGVAATVGVSVIDLRAQGGLGFACLVAAAVGVVLFSWRVGIPTSMTLALVGAMIGWTLAGGRAGGVNWSGADRVLIGIPISVVGGGVIAYLLYAGIRKLFGDRPHASLLRVARFQVATAAFQAFAYGANDLEKTVGLIAVARTFTAHNQPLTFTDGLPVLFAFALFAAGTLLGGSRIARRVGFGVFKVRPLQALSQQLVSGGVVTVLAAAGAPVSMTQTIAGGLVGVGAGMRASAIRWGVVRELLASWVLTLPLALALAALIHLALRLAHLAP
jgi:inorganic phosphate transporter, PiT family